MSKFPDYMQISNLGLIEELYKQYLSDPQSIESSWRHFFEGVDFGMAQQVQERGGGAVDIRTYELILAYRRFGHLEARLDPLGALPKEARELALDQFGFTERDLDLPFPTHGLLDRQEAPLREIIQHLKDIYSSSIGFECTDLASIELQEWLEKKIEGRKKGAGKKEVLEALIQAEVFETFLQTKYTGQTRFSAEGCETVIPLLTTLFETLGRGGVKKIFLGTAHRARLNILANIVGKPLAEILDEFEDDMALSIPGTNDIRYHLGFSGKWKEVEVEMPPNPSHLESIDPIVLGQTRATFLTLYGGDQNQAAAVMLHGDASLAGLGVVYESLQFMNLAAYTVGGAIHVAINNQIGYTTSPLEGRSTQYCTDIAKTFRLPVFHVNAEDVEACLFVAELAAEVRQRFHTDVFIDLVCYRKYGHNEGDEPAFTQPLEYAKIQTKKTIRQIYAEEMGVDAASVEAMIQASLAKMEAALKEKPQKSEPQKRVEEAVQTLVSEAEIRSVIKTFCTVPEGFSLHPKLQKWLDNRKSADRFDWSTGECLALGTLANEKIAVRLAGEDTQRGTFNQRHMVWRDGKTGKTYCPFSQYPGRFDVINSPLTEYAGMGFEYGYSWEAKNCLVLWEAQYGDFNNGAQTIIDQYLVAAEEKWLRYSSLVLLLPHGFEGSGAEHASGRPERFLQLAAHNNIRVAIPTTPAQYFHLLRRQALCKVKRPLIIFTPKSLLRAPACTSPISDFTSKTFETIIDAPTSKASIRRLILCSGKVYYDLAAANKRDDIAIVRVEQLYPLDEPRLQSILAKYQQAECMWVQEDPENMGAWNYIRPHLPRPIYVGREASGTVATGSSRKHKLEQQAVIAKAFS